MAANIEEFNGVYSFVENTKSGKAWHGLGQTFDRPLFVMEALQESHANYTVGTQPIAALTQELLNAISRGEMIDPKMLEASIINGKKATMRLDKNNTLGVVSDSYAVVQNEDAFKFIDLMCSGDKSDRTDTPVIETAGVLGNGERIFVTAKFKDDIIINNNENDRVQMYMVFTTSHDGSGAVQCMVTPTRVVCNNTLNYAMAHNSGKLCLRHTANIMKRLDLLNHENAEFAFKALNMYDIYKNSLEESFTKLSNKRLTDETMKSILAKVILSEKNLKIYEQNGGNIEDKDISTRGRNLFTLALDNIESGIGQGVGERGSAMWFLNGITTFNQNACKFKDNEYKLDSLLAGNAQKRLQKAYDLVAAA